MISNIYETAFIGATVFACAAAESYAENNRRCIIIDSGIIPGYDYAAAFKGDGNSIGFDCSFTESQAFKKECIDRGVIAEGSGEHLPALTPILANRLKMKGVECLFMSHVVNVEDHGDHYSVRVFGTGGFHTIKTKNITDTLPEKKFYEKTLNANIEIEKNAQTFQNIVRGKFSGEAYMKFTVANDAQLCEARIGIYKYITGNPEKFNGIKIIHLAGCFDYKTRPSHDNFMAAYDAGVKSAVNGGIIL